MDPHCRRLDTATWQQFCQADKCNRSAIKLKRPTVMGFGFVDGCQTGWMELTGYGERWLVPIQRL